MTNDSNKTTKKKIFFCSYEISLLSKLYDNRAKKTGIPFLYFQEVSIRIKQYIRTVEILYMKFRRNQFFMPAALPRQKLT